MGTKAPPTPPPPQPFPLFSPRSLMCVYHKRTTKVHKHHSAYESLDENKLCWLPPHNYSIPALRYPDNRGFSCHTKNGEKRKTSGVCAINRPGVWTSHIGQTGCVTGFSPSCHSRAWTVCISAGQNGKRLIKMAREEIGLQLVLKLYWVMLNRILTRYLQRLFFCLLFSCAKENLCYQGSLAPTLTMIL